MVKIMSKFWLSDRLKEAHVRHFKGLLAPREIKHYCVQFHICVGEHTVLFSISIVPGSSDHIETYLPTRQGDTESDSDYTKRIQTLEQFNYFGYIDDYGSVEPKGFGLDDISELEDEILRIIDTFNNSYIPFEGEKEKLEEY
jgi:hypothetical protein